MLCSRCLMLVLMASTVSFDAAQAHETARLAESKPYDTVQSVVGLQLY